MPTTTVSSTAILDSHTRVVRTLEHVIASGALEKQSGVALARALHPIVNSIGERSVASINDIALDVGLDASTVSRHVARLRSHGLVDQVTRKGDQRTTWVKLTARGTRLRARTRDAWSDVFAQALRDWDPEDAQRLVELYEAFARDLQEAFS